MRNSTVVAIAKYVPAALLALITVGSAQPTITRYSYENTGGDLGSNRVYAMAIQPGTDSKVIWFGGRTHGPDSEQRTYEAGLSRLEIDTGGNETWTLFTRMNSGLPGDWIYDLEFDHEGNLWIATTAEGAGKLEASALGNDPGQDGWTVYYKAGSGIGYDRIYDIAIAPDSTIWFGHGAGDNEATVALSIFDGDSQWRLINRSDTGVLLTENRCYAITFDTSGTAWLGLKSDGIFEFDYNGTPFIADDDTWTRHERDYNLIYACSAASHPNGDVWFGHSEQGASRYVASTGTWVNYPMPNPNNEDVLSRIRSIIVDSQGVVWLGAKGGKDDGSSGLWRFDPEEDEAPVNVYRQAQGGDLVEDDDNFINKVAIDEANRIIWLATDFYSEDLEIYGVVKIEGLYEPKDTPSSVIGDGAPVPSGFSLAQNYPNPFNPETKIEYSLDKSGQITLSVYSITGGLIRTLDAGYRPAGTYTAMWDGRDAGGRAVGSGVYVYQLTSEQGHRIMKKAVFLK